MILKIDDQVLPIFLVTDKYAKKGWIYLKDLSPEQLEKSYTVISLDLEDNSAAIAPRNKTKRFINAFPIEQLVLIKKERFKFDLNLFG